jgi:hypothetical protein
MGALLVGLPGLGGCVNPQTRMQVEEDRAEEKDLNLRTIGDITTVGNLAPQPISGVGLVTGLNGTGGSPAQKDDFFRKLLESDLLKKRIPHVKELLECPNNALVLVSGTIPAGVRKGDPLDIDVTLPQGSKASSLRGGFLQECVLTDYATSRDLKPDAKDINRLLLGHILAHASGPLVVGLGSNEEPDQLRRARVWSGGVSHIDRGFYLVLKNNDQKFLRYANAVAQRINAAFPNDTDKREQMLRSKQLLILDEVKQQINQKFTPPGLGQRDMARAVFKDRIEVKLPYMYRYNPERYLRVVRLIPLENTNEQQDRYRRRLEKMLLDPAKSVRAALRLEALGNDSIPILQQALKNEHPLVRFTSAEALTYLGSTAGCETLAQLSEQHVVLRAYCLLALASLQESPCRQHLSDMLAVPDAELRCGAFEALRRIDYKDKRLGGELVNDAFWLHQVAAGSLPMVFFATRERAEIVLFGSDIRLTPPVKIYVRPEFTITAEAGDDRCTITRFTLAQGEKVYRQCSLRLDDVLRTLAELGGQYPDAIGLLTKAEELRCLSCPVRFQTLPEKVSVETLARSWHDADMVQAP